MDYACKIQEKARLQRRKISASFFIHTMEEEYKITDRDFEGRRWSIGNYVGGNFENSSGAFGTVYLGIPRPRQEDVKPCALKVMDTMRIREVDFDREYEIMDYVSKHLIAAGEDAAAFVRPYEGWKVRTVNGCCTGVFAVEVLRVSLVIFYIIKNFIYLIIFIFLFLLSCLNYDPC